MLKPKCIYANKDFGYSTTGHLTPCCWANVSYADSYLEDLFTDALHIDNVDSIEDILNSKPWQDFYGMLINEPERAPRLCKKYCSVDLDTDIEGKRKSIKWKDE
jgi:hypothetical protein